MIAPLEWRAPSLAPLPGRAFRTILEDHALGLELFADAVGLLEVLGLARGLPGSDRCFDLGIARAGRAGGRPAEPGLGILLQQAEGVGAGAQLGGIAELMDGADGERRVEVVG